LKINPRSWLSYNNLGVTYEAEKNWDRAVVNYLSSARIHTNAIVWNNIGAVRMYQQRFLEAAKAFTKAIELQPENAILYNNLGAAWLAVGDRRRAEENLRVAWKIDPNLLELQKNLKKLGTVE